MGDAGAKKKGGTRDVSNGLGKSLGFSWISLGVVGHSFECEEEERERGERLTRVGAWMRRTRKPLSGLTLIWFFWGTSRI